jgi:superfamily II DNA or RNA helicase
MKKNLRPYQIKALDSLKKHNKGICVLPTGSGKTLIFMEDVKQRILQATSPLVFVIVAPKILLSSQLSSEFESYLMDFTNIFHTSVHSGEDGITKPSVIHSTCRMIKELNYHNLIFTTYKSLPRIHEAGIQIDVAIFDEAHHSVLESNFVGVAYTSKTAKNTFFYTATPKHTASKTTMANSSVYGGTILSIPPKELVSSGYILPPRVETYDASESDDINIINFIDSIEELNPKVLVAVPSTKIMMDMFTETELLNNLEERGFNIFHITSKYGCVVNNVKKSRSEFFEQLNTLGNDDSEKLIVFHHSIISEGISIDAMSHALLLRNLSVVDYVQTIGRILRLHREDSKNLQEGKIRPGEYHLYKKPCGVIAFPSNDSRGNSIKRKLESIVNTLYVQGETLIA